MEAQLTRPQEHYYEPEQQPQEVGEMSTEGDQDDQHHGKRSVLKKVKAKAKKLKDTIKLHAHGHNHDQEHGPDDHDLDEEDDDAEEETFGQQNQQTGGVPKQPAPAAYESAAATSCVPGQVGHIDSQQGSRVAMQEQNASGGNYIRGTSLPIQDIGIGQPELDVGRSVPVKQVPDTPLNTPAAGISSVNVADNSREITERIEPISREQETYGGQPEKVLERPTAMEEEHPYTFKLADQSRDIVDPIKPSLGSKEADRGQLGNFLEGTTAMKDDRGHLLKLADQPRDDVDLTKPSVREQETDRGQLEKVLGGPTAMEQEPDDLKLADQSREDGGLTKPPLHEQEMNRVQREEVMEGATAVEQDPHAPEDRRDLTKPSLREQETNRGQLEKVLGGPTAMEQEPDDLKLADQSRDDVGLTKPSLHEQEMNRGQLGEVLEGATAVEQDPHAPKNKRDDYEPSNYESKVTDPTGAGGKEAGISPMLQSFGKMEIKDEQKPRGQETYPEEPRDTQQPLLPTGSHDQLAPELTPPVPLSTQESGDDSPITSETLKPPTELHEHPTEKPSNQSSYTDKLSAATSTVDETSVATKNVVASKLGYGEGEQKPEEDNKKPASPGGYSKTIATVTGKLTPVYEKVAGAGRVVMSKVQGKGGSNGAAINTVNVQDVKQGTEDNNIKTSQSSRGNSKTITAAVTEKLSPVYEKVKETGSAVFSKVQGTGTSNEVDGSNPRGATMTSYIAEKLKPGEEDKALSEVIKEKLYKPKEEVEKPPIERVTESEEVKTQLGGSIDESGAGAQANTKGVVDKLKGTVGSWFGKSEETTKGSQQSLGSSPGTEGFPISTETGAKGGLQESGN